MSNSTLIGGTNMFKGYDIYSAKRKMAYAWTMVCTYQEYGCEIQELAWMAEYRRMSDIVKELS